MKYCYQIVLKGTNDSVFSCPEPVADIELAAQLGEDQRRLLKLSSVKYEVKINPVSTTISSYNYEEPVPDERFD